MPAASPPARAAQKPEGDGRRRLLILSLRSESLGGEVASILDGAVATTLASYAELDVVTQKDLAQLMELEAERTAMGCDESGCLAEVAGALGAEIVIYGQVAKLDDLYVLQLFLFDAGSAKSIGREQLTSSKVSDLAKELEPAVHRLVGPLVGRPASARSPTGAAATGTDASPGGEGVKGSGQVEGGEAEEGILGLVLLGGGGAAAAAGGLVLVGSSVAVGGAALAFYQLLGKDDKDSRGLMQWVARGGTVMGAAATLVLVVGAGIATAGVFVE